MTLLQIIIIVTGFIFLLMTLDLYERKKFNLLHFAVFFGGTAFIVLFAFDHSFLDKFGGFFGVARGADLLVYLGIIFLGYLYFDLLNKFAVREKKATKLARAFAISNAIGSFIGNTEIIFIIPSYGEDYTVINTINTVITAGYKTICIDDGNNKVNLHKELEKHIKEGQCVLIKHPLNLGQGAALQTGAEYIIEKVEGSTYVAHFDADGQHRIEDIDNYLNAFKNNPSVDVVLGSRFLGGSTMGTRRKFHKKMQLWFMKLFVGLKLTDTNNGYRVIKTEVLPKLEITLNGMAHASEIEHMIKRENLSYIEVPVTINYTEYSLQKGQPLSNAWDIFKKLIWKRFFSR